MGREDTGEIIRFTSVLDTLTLNSCPLHQCLINLVIIRLAGTIRETHFIKLKFRLGPIFGKHNFEKNVQD